MKKSRHSTEQIIRILRETDAGATTEEVCRNHNISAQTFYRWRKKYGGMQLSEARKLKELEKENAELKKLLADQMLKSKALEIALEKKHLSPERQRVVTEKVKVKLGCFGRAVCRYLGFNRSTLRYRPKPVPEKKHLLEMEIVKMSKVHPTLGYKKVTKLLRDEGWHVNKKQVQRIRREEGLQVPPKKPRIRRQGLSTGLPQQAKHRNHVCAWDFVSDYTQRGGKLQSFNLIDEYTRECHCIHADRAIKPTDVLEILEEAIEEHGAPEYIRSDNGPEFIANAIQEWLKENKIKTLYIDPGCPWQNGYVESFNGRFREECLDRELIFTLSESRVVFADWLKYYNNTRPHRSVNLQTPSAFAKKTLSHGPGSKNPPGSFRPGQSTTTKPIQNKQEITSPKVD